MKNENFSHLNLPLHEWCIITLFCAILIALAGWAFWGQQNHQLISPVPLEPEPSLTVLQVKIAGEVAKPGIYHLPLNASLKELVDQAQPLVNADLSELKWRRKLRDGQTILVPERKPITIYIEGAVKEPGPYQILSGTRLLEFADQLEVLPEADLKAIRKRRGFVREGDVVAIPFKKAKKKKSQ